MIVIVDYGLGNLGSIANIIKKVGGSALISRNRDDLLAATKLILPGVGSFDHGMKSLRDRGYEEVLATKVLGDRTPILGICLGMQLFTRSSQEGTERGLGWIDAETVAFRSDPALAELKVPHIGWSSITVVRDHPCFPNRDEPRRFYFVHSYHVCCRHEENVLATAHYGRDFTSAVTAGNLVGVQFHPEKSHRYGMALMRGFVHAFQTTSAACRNPGA